MSTTQDRKAALDELADERLSEREAAAEARQAAELLAKVEAAAALERAEAAREAAKDWSEAAAGIADAVEALIEALRCQQAAGEHLARVPGSMSVVSASAARARFGDFLGRQLFAIHRTNHLGRLNLNCAGMAARDNFSAVERQLIEGWLAEVYPEPKKEKANGKGPKHDAQDQPGAGES
jgi:hypothetical protein